jgi:hypothetical protein
MSNCISKCRDPLRSILAELDTWVTTTYPDTVVSEPESIDKEGWLNYSAPDSSGGAVTFAGARFRRDKPAGMSVVLSAKPARDLDEWVHADVGKMRPIGFAFGLPRPFRKDMTAEEWQYVYDLVAQARAVSVGQP